MSIKQENIHNLIDLYYDERYAPYLHHHNSFNQFINECILKEMETPFLFYESESNGKIYKYKLKYNVVRLKEPTDESSDDINTILFPEDFKSRFLSYSSRLIADVEQIQEIYTPETNTTITNVLYSDSNVTIGKIPIMVRSANCNTVLHKNKPNNECLFNSGGYFILKGAEKAVIPQETIAHNRCFVFPKKDKTSTDKNAYTVQVYSKLVDNLNSNLQIVSVSLKKDVLVVSMSQLTDIPVCVLFKALGFVSDKSIINHITMKAKDVVMANIIKHSITHYKNEIWKFNILDPDEPYKYIHTKEDAINYLIMKMKTTGKRFTVTNKDIRHKQMREYLHKTILERDFLPHMTGNDFNKGCFLGLMCNKLLNYYLGRIEPDDRDSLVNKRIDNVGILMGQSFRQAWKKLHSEITRFFKRKNYSGEKTDSDTNPINIIPHIKHSIIEQNLTTPLSNGTWPVSGKKGVAQMIHRYTYLQFSSIMKRVATSQQSTTTKVVGMRFVHNTQYGFYDVPETPEHGHNVGTIKQLCNISTITINSSNQSSIIKELLDEHVINLADIPPTNYYIYTRIMINGEWIGITDKPVQVTKYLKQKRVTGEIEKQVSIAHNFNKKEININTDAGRLLRPLLVVKDNKVLLSDSMLSEINIRNKTNPLQIHKWVDFLMKYPETIEFVDPEEQETLLISYWINEVEENYKKMTSIIKNPNFIGNPENRYDDTVYKKFSHCELHPSTTFGNVLSNAVFTNHNDAPRNYFAFSQHKQAMGIYSTNYRHRADIAYILHHPQVPLVFSRTAKYTNSVTLPYSQNPTVAIMMYTGYNQEDSLLMKRSAIERGLYSADSLKKESLSIAKTSTSQDETFKKPEKNRTTGMKDANYEKLNNKGYIPEETPIKNNDVLFGKTTPLAQIDEENPEITERDSSLIYKAGVPGVVDKVYTEYKNYEGYLTYSTRIRQLRIPIGGDKFCCYTSDHDVLTEKGWIPINELTMDDKIASVQMKNDYFTMMYENPLELFQYDYDGELYSVKTDQVDLVVTPNHRMIVGNIDRKRYDIELAKDIYGKKRSYKKNIDMYIPPKINYKFTIPGIDNLPNLVIPMDHWLTFFGIWIAEGWISSNEQICFTTHKPRVQEAIENINRYLKFTIDKSDETKSKYKCCFNDKRLINFVKPYALGRLKKFLPNWVWDLSTYQARTLIDGIMLSNIHVNEYGTRVYDTASKQLADDFQKLCFHAGWSCNMKLKNTIGQMCILKCGKPKKTNTDIWRLTILSAQNHPIVNKDIKDGINQKDKYIKFNDELMQNCIPNKVYCCKMNGSGIIYVRRNGCVVLSGNSRSGQKGTIGYILDDEDMPFNDQGIRPDIIINSCCIPTRMTIGQIIETLLNKYAAIEGKMIQVDQFEHINMEPVIKRLLEYKNEIMAFNISKLTADDYYKFGSETLYNGYDGKRIENPIFMGITTYLRLKHLVDDKVHARARGPLTALLRQPPEGRIRDGGFRLGEMERDAYIAHGLALSLKEKFMDSSDGYTMHICSACGLIARKKLNKDVYICDACDAKKPSEKPLEKPFIHKVNMPYACKIFIQEISSIGILPRIITRKDEFTNSI